MSCNIAKFMVRIENHKRILSLFEAPSFKYFGVRKNWCCENPLHKKATFDFYVNNDIVKSNILSAFCTNCFTVEPGLKNIYNKSYQENDTLLTAIPSFYKFTKPYPASIKIETTTLCNYRCTFCSNKNLKQRRHMSIAEFEKYWNIIQSKNIKKVCLTGLGETFLHPNIWAIIDILKKSNKQVSIVTNGSKLLKDAQKIFDHKIDHLAVSIESLYPSKYEKERIGSSLETVLEGLKKVSDLNSRSKHKVNLGMLSLILEGNTLDDCYNLISFAKEYNIEFPHFYYPYEIDTKLPLKNDSISKEKVLRIYENLKDKKETFYNKKFDYLNREHYLLLNQSKNNPRNCPDLYESYLIKVDGSIWPCNESIFCTKDIELDNLNKIIEGVNPWEIDSFSLFRLNFFEGHYSKLCHSCNVTRI